MTVCDLLKTGPQVLRADTEGASYSTTWTFIFLLLSPVSVQNPPKRFAGGSIDPVRGTTDQTGCRGCTLQLVKTCVHPPIHAATSPGLELNRLIGRAPGCLP